jgi:hypothetical protein
LRLSKPKKLSTAALATPELPPGADIRDRTSAFAGFRLLDP